MTTECMFWFPSIFMRWLQANSICKIMGKFQIGSQISLPLNIDIFLDILSKCVIWTMMQVLHDMMTSPMETFPRYWPIVRGIHRSPVNSPHKGQWRGALVFFFTFALTKPLSKQSWSWWFKTPSRSLWHHCYDLMICSSNWECLFISVNKLSDACFFKNQYSISCPIQWLVYMNAYLSASVKIKMCSLAKIY